MTPRISAAATLLLLIGSFGSAHAEVGLVNLGPGITPYAASEDGSVVAGYDTSHYFYWTADGGMVGIGGSIPGGGVGGTPSISDDGTVLVGTDFNSVSGANEISYYVIADGAWTHLGGIGGQSGTEISSGYGISGDGETVVGLGWIDAGGAHAVKWRDATGLEDLGSTVEGRSSRANAANGDGTFIGGWQDSDTGFRQGAIWVHGFQVLLWNDPGETVRLGEVADVSGDGYWAVGSGVSANGWQPWRWSGLDGAESLGHLDPAWRGAATATSFGGEVIVGFDRPFPGPATFGQGFIYTDDLGLVNLNTYAADQGIDTQGVTLALPLGISADGSTVVGIGRTAAATVGFVLTLPVPASDVDTAAQSVSSGWTLSPNPFRDETEFSFSLAAPGRVRVDIYDAMGRVVNARLFEGWAEGRVSARWDGRDGFGRSVPAGTYFARLSSPSAVAVHKLVRCE
ncbi:MAG: FlgD immunoglobulin-like domain containing protein [Candidatus Eisenbacteria bacterium]